MKVKWWHIGLLLALVIATLSPMASAWPDGLEWVAEEKGFIEVAEEPLFDLIPDYVFPGIGNEAVATILAGLVGTVTLFAIGYGMARLLVPQKRKVG